jgi:DNA-binding NtrC family response regulator
LKRILVVDDEPSIVNLLTMVLEENGWDVTSAVSGADGIEKLERGQFDVILTDLMMPGVGGIELLRASKEFRPDVEVILMTGFATADTAIEAMRTGAFHYLVKPLKIEEVLNLAEKAYMQRQLLRENQFLKAEVRAGYQIQSVVGDSTAIERVVAAAQAIAPGGDPVLLVGERGCGRSFFARFIHFCSPRSAGLFVPAHCVGLTPDRLLADLFGYLPPTGDRSAAYRSGKIEMANHGTLFVADLDEAGRETLDRLANFLDTKKLPATEGGKEAVLDIRFIASSMLSLDDLKNRGIVPPRLAAMLETGTIRIPPLRERREDVPLLLHHFLEEANEERKKPLKGFTPSALAILEPYDWPGNVRELAHLVRGISSKKKQGTMIDASDIPPEIVYRQLRRKEPREQDPQEDR